MEFEKAESPTMQASSLVNRQETFARKNQQLLI